MIIGGNVDKIDIINKIIEEVPLSPYAWYLLGTEQLEKNMTGDALVSFSEALKYCNDNLKIDIFNKLSNLSNNNNVKQEKDTVDKQTIEENYKVNEEAKGSPNEESNYIKTDNKADEGNYGKSNYNEDNYSEGNYDKGNYNEDNHNEHNYSDGDYDEEIDEKNNVIPFDVFHGGGDNSKQKKNEEKVTFEDVGGLEDLKETITMKIIKPFINPGIFQKFNKKSGGGILLYGPPGCGKTFIAKATAGQCKARFEAVSITDILDPYIGMSARHMKNIFDNAREHKPCILFFDEIDTLAYSRIKMQSEHLRSLIDQFLSEMDGININKDKLLVIGATNMLWDVDNAFKRPGRFDKTIFVPPPDEKAREIIFKLKLKNKPVKEIDYKILAKNTELYSGADIENVVEVATEFVIDEIIKTGVEREITTKDLMKAVQGTTASTKEWFRTMKNYVKYANESGQYDDVEKFIDKSRGL